MAIPNLVCVQLVANKILIVFLSQMFVLLMAIFEQVFPVRRDSYCTQIAVPNWEGIIYQLQKLTVVFDKDSAHNYVLDQVTILKLPFAA